MTGTDDKTKTLWDGSHILEAEASVSALGAAVEYNLAARARYFAADPDYTVIETDNCFRITGPRIYRVLLANFPPDAVEAGVQTIISDARRRPRYVTWVVGPLAGATNLVAHLKRQGFMIDMQEPGMGAMLAPMMAAPPPPVAGLRIVRASTSDLNGIDRFNRVAEACFKRPISLGRQIRGLAHTIGADNPHLDHMRFFVGYLDDRPVATASTMIGGGVVGLYTVGVLPAVRSRGIGTQITYHALRDAYDAGLQAAVLHASAQGYGVYARMGFCATGQLTWLSTSWHSLVNGLFGPG
ncbi:MAG: GNAT family N-acetyltransferase [Anaerolineae bacterium]|nr:GNAT family N-acetyltransferase [Anaerolineae bacterium]